MRFLADERCDFGVVVALRAAGHDVSAIVETHPGTEDAQVLALARSESPADRRQGLWCPQTARGLVNTDDQRAFVLRCSGDLAHSQGHYDEAELLHHEAIDLAPTYDSVWIALGRVARCQRFRVLPGARPALTTATDQPTAPLTGAVRSLQLDDAGRPRIRTATRALAQLLCTAGSPLNVVAHRSGRRSQDVRLR